MFNTSKSYVTDLSKPTAQLACTFNFETWLQTASFPKLLNTLKVRQNGRHFADDTLKRIFLNENAGISIQISMRSVNKGPINNIPALVWLKAWSRPGDKPLSEPMLVRLPTHICVTRPQWVNQSNAWTLEQTRTIWCVFKMYACYVTLSMCLI